jgi:hypothetical protein
VLPADEEAVIARHVAAILRHRVDDIGNNTVAARHAMETSSRD